MADPAEVAEMGQRGLALAWATEGWSTPRLVLLPSLARRMRGLSPAAVLRAAPELALACLPRSVGAPLLPPPLLGMVGVMAVASGPETAVPRLNPHQRSRRSTALSLSTPAGLGRGAAWLADTDQ